MGWDGREGRGRGSGGVNSKHVGKNENFITSIAQLENVESFKYLRSILTNDGRCTCEIKCRIAMAKAAFNKKRTLFTSTLDLEMRKKLVK